MLRKIATALTPLLIGAAVGAGVVHAEPATRDIGYRTELIGNTIVTTLTHGTFAVAGETVAIRDESGATVLSLPLAVLDGDTEYPLPHAVRDNGRVLELIAVKDAAQARPAVQPVASPQENYAAQANFASQFGIATAIGGFIGTALGAAVGLIAVLGGPTVIPGVIAGATIGGIVGTLTAGGPTLVIAGIDLINTLTAPPGTTQWAQRPAA